MSQSLETITRHLERFLQGDYIIDDTLHGQECEDIIRQLSNYLTRQSLAEIDRTVSLSIQTNETAIYSAQMLNNLREVEGKSQGIAAAAEEMVATVNEIRTYGDNIATQAQEAQEVTQKGASITQEAISQMKNISSSVANTSERVSVLETFTKEIAGIAENIKKIASQTNLLALNATIEAARAGEAGKGFAVVAAEVKNLSSETAKATENINDIITKLREESLQILESMEHSSDAVTAGEQAINSLGETMGEIKQRIDTVSNNTTQISTTLGQQGQASQEIAQGITEIANHSSKSVSGIEHIVDAMSRIERLITNSITSLAELNVPGKVVKLAKSDHVIWKKRLMNMIVGREGLNENELADHHSCRLGKWYDTLKDPSYVNDSNFKALLEPHKQVHEHGIRAVKFFNAGNHTAALTEIQKVESSSKEVLRLLEALDKAA